MLSYNEFLICFLAEPIYLRINDRKSTILRNSKYLREKVDSNRVWLLKCIFQVSDFHLAILKYFENFLKKFVLRWLRETSGHFLNRVFIVSRYVSTQEEFPKGCLKQMILISNFYFIYRFNEENVCKRDKKKKMSILLKIGHRAFIRKPYSTSNNNFFIIIFVHIPIE